MFGSHRSSFLLYQPFWYSISNLGAGFDDEKSLLMSQMSLEKRFGQSAVFVASTLMENGGVPQSATPETLLKEAIHVISCGYEDKSDWGSEVRRFCMLNGFSLLYIYFLIRTFTRTPLAGRESLFVCFSFSFSVFLLWDCFLHAIICHLYSCF